MTKSPKERSNSPKKFYEKFFLNIWPKIKFGLILVTKNWPNILL